MSLYNCAPIFLLFLTSFCFFANCQFYEFKGHNECNFELNITTFADPENCHNYYHCDDYDSISLRTCENGLLYDGKGNVHDHCNYHWAVECGHRFVNLVPESDNVHCEFKYDIQPKSTGCDPFFYKCADGIEYDTPCQPGLVYDHRIHACNWPDLLEQCSKKESEFITGFKCPQKLNPGSQSAKFWPYPRFAIPGDCKRYIFCVDNFPRLGNCGDETVFDVDSLTCVEEGHHKLCGKK